MRAIILAAGLGTRLEPLTQVCPKPLLEVLGKPIVCYLLDILEKAGVREVMLNTHHLPKLFPLRLGKKYRNLSLDYSYEPQILGTGGAISNLEQWIVADSDEDFIVLHGDILLDIDLQKMIAMHKKSKALSTLLIKQTSETFGYQTLSFDADLRIKRFASWTKYQGKSANDGLFCGVHVLSKRILKYIPKAVTCINRNIYPQLIDEGHVLQAHLYTGPYSDLGTPKRLWQANMDAVRLIEYIDDTVKMGENIKIIEPVFIAKNVEIHESSTIGPNVVIGTGCVIRRNAIISDSVVMSKTQVLESENLQNLLAIEAIRTKNSE